MLLDLLRYPATNLMRKSRTIACSKTPRRHAANVTARSTIPEDGERVTLLDLFARIERRPSVLGSAVQDRSPISSYFLVELIQSWRRGEWKRPSWVCFAWLDVPLY